MYYGAVFIGNPPKKFMMPFSTTTSELAVPSSQSKVSRSITRTYNSSESSTYIKNGKPVNLISAIPFQRRFGGFLSTDSVSLAAVDPGPITVEIKNQTFTEVTSITIPDLLNNIDGLFSIHGVFGLAYYKRSNSLAIPPFQNMLTQGLIRQPIFSLSINS